MITQVKRKTSCLFTRMDLMNSTFQKNPNGVCFQPLNE